VYRTVDQFARIIDILVSPRRDANAAHRFLQRAIGATNVTPAKVTTGRALLDPAVQAGLQPAGVASHDRSANHQVKISPPQAPSWC